MTLNDCFDAVVQTHGTRVAVVDGDRQCTYHELDQAASTVASGLRVRGVRMEEPVALSFDRSLECVIALLGVLRAGGAYVPLDPRWPHARQEQVLADSGARFLLAGEGHPQEPSTAQLLLLTELLAEPIAPAPSLDLRPGNGAYLLFTSGSTGKPKGITVTHHNVVRLFHATRADFKPGPEDTWTLFHSPAFDFSVWEIFGALLHGGRLVCVPYLKSRAPLEFLELLERERVTCLSQTPSAFRSLLAAIQEVQAHPSRLSSLRLLVFGGEALDPEWLAPWFDRFGDQVHLCNMYGITETTVHVTARHLSREDTRHRYSPIGRALPDLSLHLLDESMSPLPMGIPGELYVGGAGVTRGYHERPGLTAARFVPDPFSGVPGARLYRTGDRARHRSDGELEFLGRLDQQVKLRGFRMELGEIEAALRDLPGVRDALVRVQGEGDQRRLAAFVVGPTETNGLRESLLGRLPEYMVPSAIACLDSFPLTANGKLDEQALLAIEFSSASRTERTQPSNQLQRSVAALWREVLEREEVCLEDDFFALGGHSLLAVRLLSLLRDALDVHLSLAELFEAPTLAAQCRRIQTSPAQVLPESPCVLLQAGDTGPPLFLVHPGGGGVGCYRDLVRCLPGRTVHGLRSLGLRPEEEPLASVEAMAKCYLRAVREIQPEGALHLIGWSMGGVIGFEMTRQGLGSDAPPASLTMLDSLAPATQSADSDPRMILQELLVGFPVPVELDALVALEEDDQADYLHSLLLNAPGYGPTLDRITFRASHRTHRRNLEALARYRPAPLDANVTVIRAEAGGAGRERHPHGQDPALGWAQWVLGNLRTVPLDATHANLVEPPQVGRLAELLRYVGAARS